MKIPYIIVGTLLSLFSCSSTETNQTIKNEHEESEWTENNKSKFISKCSIGHDKDICECILEKFIEHNQNVIEAGKMTHNEYMSLAEECSHR